MLKNIVETGVSIEEILTATTKDLSEIGLKSSSIKSIHKFNYFLDLANIQFEIAQKNNYKIINFWDEDYPFLLREIYSSPMNLFVFGNLITNENCISTVSYTHLRAHETVLDLVCRLLLVNKKTTHN